MGLCVCDYMFRDECVSDVSDHLNRDMPDMPENNIGTSQEALLGGLGLPWQPVVRGQRRWTPWQLV